MAEYKICLHNLVGLLYTNNRMPYKEIEILPFTKSSRPTKYLGIDLSKELKVLNNESFMSQKQGVEGEPTIKKLPH